MARHVDRRRLPPNRTVVKFDFRDPKRRYWMVIEPSEVSVCLQHPGFDVDLEVSVDTTTLYRVYLGRAELGGAIRAGQLTMSGPRTLQRAFGHWFTWSAFAPASRSAQERRTAASRLASPHRVRIAEYGDPGTNHPPGRALTCLTDPDRRVHGPAAGSSAEYGRRAASAT